MKYILLTLFLVPMLMSATVHRVNQNGSGAFVTIQSAINYASSGDTVLVHPGTYIENVVINQKSITLASLELTTRDSTYISQTIINGNQVSSCVRITNSQNAVIRGLYLTNGVGYLGSGNRGNVGGGIYSDYSSINVINCKIIRNMNVTSGAGIYAENCSLVLAGTTISNNHGFNGGALVFPWSTISFDPFNRCSIYLNTATAGNDITLTVAGTYQIFLEKFSVPNSSDYIHEFIFAGRDVQYSLDYNSVAITPELADLYVSPNGSDENSGLTAEQPLRTIAWALLKIKADSLHHQTIYLADGVYSYSLNKQKLPLNLRSYVTIQGESQSGTIIDCENRFTAMHGKNAEQNTKVRNITIINGSLSNISYFYMLSFPSIVYDEQGNPIKSSVELHNVSFKNCYANDPHSGAEIVVVANPLKLDITNLEILDCTGSVGLNLIGSNIHGDNIRINNFQPGLGENQWGRAMTVTTNCNSVLNKPNVFSNLRITNCESNQVDWQTSTALYISGVYVNYAITENYFFNTTIANNTCQPGYGSAVTMGSFAKATFINSIISNNYPRNVLLRNDYGDIRARFLNCLIKAENPGESPVLNLKPNINSVEWYGNNMYQAPDFDTNNTNNPFYLSAFSPCINAGTTDFSLFTLPDFFSFPETDLAGEKRIYDNQVDLGAYEWCGTALPDEPTPVAEIDKMVIYPNPFNPQTTVKFSLKEKSAVEINIYNTKGQLVKKLMSEVKSAGQNQIIWNGKDDNNIPCSSGIYYCKLIINNKVQTTKMVLMK